MPIKQFTIGFSRTINLGNYESARVEASVTSEIQDYDDLNASDNLSTAKNDAQIELTNLLKETMRKQFPITTPKKDKGTTENEQTIRTTTS